MAREAVRRRAGPAIRAVAVGLTYAAVYKLIQEVTSFGNVTGATFWPGAGLSVAVLLLRPRREWPWYLGAVGIAEVAMDLQAGFSPEIALAWGVANTAEPLAAATLLTRSRGWTRDLAKRADFGRFLAAAVLAGPALGALIGAGVPAILGTDPLWPRLPRWFVGDAMGVLVVAPFLLVLASPERPRVPRPAWPLLALGVAALVAIGPWDFPGEVGLPFLIPPIMALVAVRLRTRGVAIGVFGVAAIVLTVTAAGAGPFAESGAFAGLAVAQMFLAMTAILGFIVAALTSELVSRDVLEEALRHQALYDSLTGVANRRLLVDRLTMASNRLRRHPGRIALLFVDLDRFKRVNDEHGHHAGDLVLQAVATRLASVMRSEDTVARIGGDEFGVLIEEAEPPTALTGVAARIGEAISAPIELDDGVTVQIGASVGTATSTAPLKDPLDLLDSADAEMYRAKRAAPVAPAAVP
jgi:diguanylate cyclase (GGDEF)-like protein